MSQTNYKYATIILAILVIVFAYLYFTKPDATIQNVNESVSSNLQACSERLAEWDEEYGSAPASSEKQDALNEVLEDCQGELGQGSDTLAE